MSNNNDENEKLPEDFGQAAFLIRKAIKDVQVRKETEAVQAQDISKYEGALRQTMVEFMENVSVGALCVCSASAQCTHLTIADGVGIQSTELPFWS